LTFNTVALNEVKNLNLRKKRSFAKEAQDDIEDKILPKRGSG